MSKPKIATPKPLPTPPKRDEDATLLQDARRRARNARGAAGSVFTSALGDAGFGRSVSRATLLGQSA
uniref:hypothetical protein n=1 Tax=Pararhizobium sp. IMCC3301 TaxID=3067904 RepID=UPI0027410EAC|nr:hypothetical protein [Pararhizobium sp. IMCC3301]